MEIYDGEGVAAPAPAVAPTRFSGAAAATAHHHEASQ